MSLIQAFLLHLLSAEEGVLVYVSQTDSPTRISIPKEPQGKQMPRSPGQTVVDRRRSFGLFLLVGTVRPPPLRTRAAEAR